MSSKKSAMPEPCNIREKLLHEEAMSFSNEAKRRYVSMLKDGVSIVLAHMLASRRAPARGENEDDQAFTKAYREKMDSMPKWKRDLWVSKARANGIDASGKFKIPGIPPTESDAWVTTVDDMKAVYKKRGLSCEGLVNIRPVVEEPAKSIPLSEKITKKIMQEKIEADPSLAEKVRKNNKKLQELREEVIAVHGRPSKPGVVFSSGLSAISPEGLDPPSVPSD